MDFSFSLFIVIFYNELISSVGKSCIYGDTEFAQYLFDKYAGSGKVTKDRKCRTNQEICTANKVIGFDIQVNSETNMFKIHHSKYITHIVT